MTTNTLTTTSRPIFDEARIAVAGFWPGTPRPPGGATRATCASTSPGV
jgi:hypothetical protein